MARRGVACTVQVQSAVHAVVARCMSHVARCTRVKYAAHRLYDRQRTPPIPCNAQNTVEWPPTCSSCLGQASPPSPHRSSRPLHGNSAARTFRIRVQTAGGGGPWWCVKSRTEASGILGRSVVWVLKLACQNGLPSRQYHPLTEEGGLSRRLLLSCSFVAPAHHRYASRSRCAAHAPQRPCTD